MKIHLYSDTHLDTYKDQGAGFMMAVRGQHADVAVLAGDITTGRFPDSFQKVFDQFSKQYKHVVVVPGNHEYYGCDEAQVKRSYLLAAAPHANVHVLDCQSVKLDGHVFHGGTMWYVDGPMNAMYEDWMNDKAYIKNFKPWVYEKQAQFELHLRKELMEGDIVVTHHLPSYQSVDPFYKTSPLNRFFVCDMEYLVFERKPALWMHGHTHMPCDYVIDETRIVCNPRGYPGERQKVYMPKEIEI